MQFMEKYKEVFDKIQEVGENLKFDVDIRESEVYNNIEFIFSKYSPLGQDFYINIIINKNDNDESEDILDNFISELDKFYEGYDVSYETYLWLDEWGHGKNGAPYDMRDLYNDFESCDKYIEELLNKVKEIEF